jgi:hypothetical protein
VDEFINNDYQCIDMSDSEYLSDESLKMFLKQLSKKDLKASAHKEGWIDKKDKKSKTQKDSKNKKKSPT